MGTFSGKKKAHRLKINPRDTGQVSLGHPAGQTGVYGPVSQKFSAIYKKNGQKRAFLPGHRPGVPGTPGHRVGFQKFYAIFLMCLFCSLLFPTPQRAVTPNMPQWAVFPLEIAGTHPMSKRPIKRLLNCWLHKGPRTSQNRENR